MFTTTEEEVGGGVCVYFDSTSKTAKRGGGTSDKLPSTKSEVRTVKTALPTPQRKSSMKLLSNFPSA